MTIALLETSDGRESKQATFAPEQRAGVLRLLARLSAEDAWFLTSLVADCYLYHLVGAMAASPAGVSGTVTLIRALCRMNDEYANFRKGGSADQTVMRITYYTPELAPLARRVVDWTLADLGFLTDSEITALVMPLAEADRARLLRCADPGLASRLIAAIGIEAVQRLSALPEAPTRSEEDAERRRLVGRVLDRVIVAIEDGAIVSLTVPPLFTGPCVDAMGDCPPDGCPFRSEGGDCTLVTTWHAMFSDGAAEALPVQTIVDRLVRSREIAAPLMKSLSPPARVAIMHRLLCAADSDRRSNDPELAALADYLRYAVYNNQFKAYSYEGTSAPTVAEEPMEDILAALSRLITTSEEPAYVPAQPIKSEQPKSGDYEHVVDALKLIMIDAYEWLCPEERRALYEDMRRFDGELSVAFSIYLITADLMP